MVRREFDVVVRNGLVVNENGSQRLDVGVRAGMIAALVTPGTEINGTEEIDADGHYVLPGGIDTHTHVSWPYAPDRTTSDGFAGAGAAAALGGTTTMVDFVPPAPPNLRFLDAAQRRIEQIEAESPIDVALHQIINRLDPQTLADIPAVIDLGLVSFKMFTTYEADRVNDGEIWALMRCIADNGGLPGFHAENHDILDEATAEMAAAGRTTMHDFAAARPAVAEASAIQTVSLMARELGTPVFIFHVSGSLALSAIDAARSAGATVHAETCTHYLTFDNTVFDSPESWKFSITPPIRGTADREDLWNGVANGRITTVGSDHCSYPADEKAAHPEDYRQSPFGAAGVQNRTPVLWDASVNQRHLPPEVFVQISATRAARAMGMYPRKGVIQVGSDADIVVLDPDQTWNGGDLRPASKDTFCLYEKYDGAGLARHVLSRGRPIVRDFEYSGAAGQGGFLKRSRIGESRPTHRR